MDPHYHLRRSYDGNPEPQRRRDTPTYPSWILHRSHDLNLAVSVHANQRWLVSDNQGSRLNEMDIFCLRHDELGVQLEVHRFADEG